MIIAALIFLFGGGDTVGTWILPANFKEQVEEIIIDENSQENVIDIYDRMVDLDKEYSDHIQKMLDKFETALQERDAEDSGFQELLDEILSKRKAMATNMLSARMDLVIHITEEE